MSGGIYLIQDGDQLVEMNEKPYNSDALLQEFLEKYPNLLAIDATDSDLSRRWLVIKRSRENGSEDVGTQQWLVNHLFLDRQGIPTLVDVHYNTAPELRQEIVGQMLDYAANVAIYWPVESILAQFEGNCEDQNRDPGQVFEEFLGENADEEAFWQQVKTNLQAGKIRLVFVADKIPPELQRVVEFLNKQIDPAEVLAVEIKQYVSDNNGFKTLVSNVIGQTAEAQQRKSRTARDRRQWNQESFLNEYQVRYGEDEVLLVEHIYQWIEHQQSRLQIQWTSGDIYGGFSAKVMSKENRHVELFFLGIDGELQIASDQYAILAPFDQPKEWEELRNQLTSIGLALPTNPAQRRFPKISLSTLPDETALKPVLKTFDWVINKIQVSSGT